jgi:hypothetical protein
MGCLTRACSRRSRLSRSVLAHGPRQPSSLLKHVVRTMKGLSTLSRSTAVCATMVALCLHPLPARAELQAHPLVGLVVPTRSTEFTVDEYKEFSAGATSAFGLDLELLSGESGWRPTASYWHDGGSATNDELNYTMRGNNVGIGVCRSVRLGSGSLEIGVEAVRRSWCWKRNVSSVRSAAFEDSQTGLMGSLRLSAPLSSSICLDAVAKFQSAGAVRAQATTEDGAAVAMRAAGQAFVLAMGLGWRFGGF